MPNTPNTPYVTTMKISRRNHEWIHWPPALDWTRSLAQECFVLEIPSSSAKATDAFHQSDARERWRTASPRDSLFAKASSWCPFISVWSYMALQTDRWHVSIPSAEYCNVRLQFTNILSPSGSVPMYGDDLQLSKRNGQNGHGYFCAPELSDRCWGVKKYPLPPNTEPQRTRSASSVSLVTSQFIYIVKPKMPPSGTCPRVLNVQNTRVHQLRDCKTNAFSLVPPAFCNFVRVSEN